MNPIKVRKKSGEFFVSGYKVNTAIGIVIDDGDPEQKEKYIFKEDNSTVSVDKCEIVKPIEYIPGDYVMYLGKIAKIIGKDSTGRYVIFGFSDIRYETYIELTPILMTLEILEKNGWIRTRHRVDEDNFEWYVYKNPEIEEIVFQYYPGSKTNMFSAFYYGDQEILQVDCVHELQHLLFGLGIDYKIEI